MSLLLKQDRARRRLSDAGTAEVDRCAGGPAVSKLTACARRLTTVRRGVPVAAVGPYAGVVMRDLDWGCCNVRDLGGLSTEDGRITRRNRVIRSDNPSRLTLRGWDALWNYGVRTVVTLRTVGTTDPEPDLHLVPAGMAVERVYLEDATDPEFRRRCIDTGWWATPLQWAEMLQLWPERCAAAVGAVARANEGGVVVSCGVGRDRTGLVTFLLLALAGVRSDEIASDWARGIDRLIHDPVASELPVLEVLERNGATALSAIDAAIGLGVEDRLCAGGLDPDDITAVRDRLLA